MEVPLAKLLSESENADLLNDNENRLNSKSEQTHKDMSMHSEKNNIIDFREIFHAINLLASLSLHWRKTLQSKEMKFNGSQFHIENWREAEQI